MNIQESKAIITVSNTVSPYCPFDCEGVQKIGVVAFQDAINHLISAHGCSLIHVGGETTEGPDGKPWQGTIAVLGSPEELPQRATPQIYKPTRRPGRA
ncbi:hypothetical protein [Xanthomonas campestris]|uniref:hypothetical protein n=1 Tax=Xanthomonas campestris TaxID=339 RepID=UPI001E599B29|nr:hypothetical protein [Xanthomonas campestris]MCC5074253.1 hypothetical protein [Xanthomonas campestris pv. plantaginis]